MHPHHLADAEDSANAALELEQISRGQLSHGTETEPDASATTAAAADRAEDTAAR